MYESEFTCKTTFEKFSIERMIAEPCQERNLFNEASENKHAKQLKIFHNLENRMPMFGGASFSNQVHFQNAYKTPVQRWFPYREGYSTRLVNAFISELKITGNVFDPFSGSGTTLMASRTNNLRSFGMDVNPISVLVAKVENEKYNCEDIKNISLEIRKIQSFTKSNESFETSFELAEKMFNNDILQSLLQLKKYILDIQNDTVRNLFFVAWLSIIEQTSNIKKEGNGLKYKNRKRTANGYVNIEKDVWEAKTFPKDKFEFVQDKLTKHLGVILTDIEHSFGSCETKPKVFEGNCLEFDEYFYDQLQLTFFSPPYCNCFDYFEIHKVDLWLGGFVKSKEDFRLLRKTGFRSNNNSVGRKPVVYKNENIEQLISLFDVEMLWNCKIPSVVRGYFDDMNTLFSKLHQQTIYGGFVGVVVGNSAYAGVIIPTDILIADIAKEIGFKVRNIFVTRHLTTSSQQKRKLSPLKNYLRESIVLLQK